MIEPSSHCHITSARSSPARWPQSAALRAAGHEVRRLHQVFVSFFVLGLLLMVGKKYVVCPNAACKPFSNPNMKSWRMIDGLEPGAKCKYCDSKFPVQGGGGQNKGWNVQDSKGRARPAPQQDSPEASSVLSEVSLQELFKAKILSVKEESQKQQLQDQFAQVTSVLFPVQPKTDEDLLKEALAQVEKAATAVEHQSRTAATMDDTLRKKAESFMLYKDKVDTHHAKLREAREELANAHSKLEQLQADNAKAKMAVSDSKPTDVAAIVGQYSPDVQVAQGLNQVPELQGISTEAAAAIAKFVTNTLQNHMGILRQQISDAQKTSSSVLPPPAHPPQTQSSPQSSASASFVIPGGAPQAVAAGNSQDDLDLQLTRSCVEDVPGEDAPMTRKEKREGDDAQHVDDGGPAKKQALSLDITRNALQAAQTVLALPESTSKDAAARQGVAGQGSWG